MRQSSTSNLKQTIKMNRFFYYSLALLSFFTLIGSTTGCGPRGLGVEPVTGTITYDGAPLAGALVAFVSTNEFGHSASTVTAEDGTYSLSTYAAKNPGAVIGNYNVFVSKTMMVDRHGNEYLDESQPVGPLGRPDVKHLIPKKYSGMDNLPPLLNATVQKGKNVFDFNLED